MLSGLPQQLVVMSENLYMGADPVGVLAASVAGVPALAIGAVTQFWNDVQKTNYGERADVIAQQIASRKPDLVGLQEVMKYYSGTPDSLWGVRRKPATSSWTSCRSCWPNWRRRVFRTSRFP